MAATLSSFSWEWKGSPDPKVQSGTLVLIFPNDKETLFVPKESFTAAKALAEAIDEAIRLAVERGRRQLLEQIGRIEP